MLLMMNTDDRASRVLLVMTAGFIVVEFGEQHRGVATYGLAVDSMRQPGQRGVTSWC